MKREPENSTGRRIKEVSDSSEWDDLFKGGTLKTSKTFEDCEYDGYLVKFDLSFGDMYVHPSRPVDVRLNDCVFTGKVRIYSRERNLTFENCEFHSEMDASESRINGKIRFMSCVFLGSTNFRNTKFKDLADFWRSTFQQKTVFYKTDFLGTAVFSATTFEKNVLFTYTLIEKLILFRGTKIREGIDLSTAIITGSVGTFGLSLWDFKEKKGKLSDTEFESAVSESGDIPIKNKRETFRILKQANIQQNNVIESLPYQALEKKTLLTELLDTLQKPDTFKEWWRSFWDLIVLGLNWISNYFGRAPMQGVIFTLTVGVLFFYLNIIQTEKYEVALNLDWNIVRKEIPNYLNFILPTHGLDYLGSEFYEKYSVSNWYYVWDIVGRIFVGFGIYQTIQAFRKFR
ncbi:pentapeptide repeat-containing protein [Algoriphagus aestuariicola]|uniref:Pentapeptide repeat-containing protein n=1 Tax=Algoriphagus aestuariicola TaxID=1852016 RepID=A0ABS3BJS6_9BACT|nr:pentapeptide repeat-containing protein [Algoriphagus aestuariicola]MBN7799237.1 pentapeptide repeat-containing protein [Algoriphagus aestuariicola]